MQRQHQPYTLESHRDHLTTLIAEMEEEMTEATDNKDADNAKNQLAFAKDMRDKINEMLSLSGLHVKAKTALGEKMRLLPTQYFGHEEVPMIEGELSREFSLKIARHYQSFTRVKFSSIEMSASILAAKSGIFNVISISDQIAHHDKLAKKIVANVEEYKKYNSSCLISK